MNDDHTFSQFIRKQTSSYLKINNECYIEGRQLGADIANIFLKYARVAEDQADNGEVRRKLTKLFEFMMKKPSKIELNNFIQESMS